jgi:hypothetical protein
MGGDEPEQKPSQPEKPSGPPQIIPDGDDQTDSRSCRSQPPEPFVPFEKLKEWLVRLFSEPITFVTLLLFGATVALYCATRTLVNDANHNARQQLRAYVLFDEGYVSVVNGKYKVVAKVRNGGATPAVNMTRSIEAVALKQGIAPRDREELRLKETAEFSTDLLPNSSFDISEGRNDIVTDSVRKDVRNGDDLYIIGLVKYRDVFGRCQYSGFMSYASEPDAKGVRKLIVFQNPSTHVEGKSCQNGKADYP